MSKKLKVGLVLAAALVALAAFEVAVVSPARGGIWDSIANSNLKEIEPTANYEIATYGYDSRVYEWTPAFNPGISCVFVASNKSSGVACYPKAQ
jgi:hypothetical protein